MVAIRTARNINNQTGSGSYGNVTFKPVSQSNQLGNQTNTSQNTNTPVSTTKPSTRGESITELQNLLKKQDDNVKEIALDLARYNKENLTGNMEITQPYRERDFQLKTNWEREKMDKELANENYWKQKQLVADYTQYYDERNLAARKLEQEGLARRSAQQTNENLVRAAASSGGGGGGGNAAEIIAAGASAASNIAAAMAQFYGNSKQNRSQLLQAYIGGK